MWPRTQQTMTAIWHRCVASTATGDAPGPPPLSLVPSSRSRSRSPHIGFDFVLPVLYFFPMSFYVAARFAMDGIWTRSVSAHPLVREGTLTRISGQLGYRNRPFIVLFFAAFIFIYDVFFF